MTTTAKIHPEADQRLEAWAEWKRSQLGKGSQRLPRSLDSGVRVAALVRMDSNRENQAADAIIGQMSSKDRCAVYHRYLGSIYRFPGDPGVAVLEAAVRFIEAFNLKGATE